MKKRQNKTCKKQHNLIYTNKYVRVNNEVMGKANFVAKYLTQCAIKGAMILNDNVKADLTLGSDHLRPIVQI